VNIGRIRAIEALARRSGCDAILVSDPVDVVYSSGFKSSNAYLLVSKKERLLFSDFRYRSAAQAFCRANTSWQFSEIRESAYGFVAAHLPKGARVGVDAAALSLEVFDRLVKNNRGIAFVKLHGDIAAVATVKTPAEIRAMARAARIADRAFAELLIGIRLGQTEAEVARRLDALCLTHGSEGAAFDTIVLFGARSALPHGAPGTRRLRRSDWILCDFGCRCAGFCSDMTRTMTAGPANDQQKKIYHIVHEAQRRARCAAKPAMTTAQLDAVARDYITESGFGDYFGHATGHGVGRRIHEKPRVAKTDTTRLRPDMVVTIEPGIYLPRFGGVRLEDQVVITDAGIRTLTNTPRRLLELSL
jgi:Xaa-Pro aminopeptidase